MIQTNDENYPWLRVTVTGRGRCVVRVESTRMEKGRYADVIYLKTDSRIRPVIPIYVIGHIIDQKKRLKQ